MVYLREDWKKYYLTMFVLHWFNIVSMDDLTEALSASFAVSKEHNSTAAPHPRLAQYKSKYSVLEQSERRRRFLDLQKR